MLGKNIRAARERKGLTQKEVAESIGMNRVNYVRLESGTKIPSLSMTITIAKLLGCSIDKLVEEEMANHYAVYDTPIGVRHNQNNNRGERKGSFLWC